MTTLVIPDDIVWYRWDGAILVRIPDPDDSRQMQDSLLEELSGGEPITVRALEGAPRDILSGLVIRLVDASGALLQVLKR